jgi:hypothetical protein
MEEAYRIGRRRRKKAIIVAMTGLASDVYKNYFAMFLTSFFYECVLMVNFNA